MEQSKLAIGGNTLH